MNLWDFVPLKRAWPSVTRIDYLPLNKSLGTSVNVGCQEITEESSSGKNPGGGAHKHIDRMILGDGASLDEFLAAHEFLV